MRLRLVVHVAVVHEAAMLVMPVIRLARIVTNHLSQRQQQVASLGLLHAHQRLIYEHLQAYTISSILLLIPQIGTQ